MKKKTNLIRTLCHRAHKICSRKLFTDEIKQIKLILNKNGYSQELVDKIINLHLYSLNKIKPTGPKKRLILLVLPFFNRNSRILERNIFQLVDGLIIRQSRSLFSYPNQCLDLGDLGEKIR